MNIADVKVSTIGGWDNSTDNSGWLDGSITDILDHDHSQQPDSDPESIMYTKVMLIAGLLVIAFLLIVLSFVSYTLCCKSNSPYSQFGDNQPSAKSKIKCRVPHTESKAHCKRKRDPDFVDFTEFRDFKQTNYRTETKFVQPRPSAATDHRSEAESVCDSEARLRLQTPE
ncbi:unnamed protein product [Moneuplotes crassus]|uniref:Uncharacterized protein n=2 Tax=Euplotes crassus TaxID=5936 RepID=A0AAD1XZ95_EUPCR|nr:unnamed protein product [Moneuplotes crassus]